MNICKNVLSTGAIALAAGAAHAQLDVVLIVDISVENEVTITSTSGVSAVTASGSDGIGVYLADFFTSDAGGTFVDTLISGDLTSAQNTSDGSPLLFRGTFPAVDAGLNIFSYTDDVDSEFVAGSQAFSGSATWTVDPDDYADLLSANTSGTVFFPADTVDDIAGGAVAIGTYQVIPAPASAALLGLSGLAAARRRR
ncbi:MAG: VPLPA-CTERM sorting domain-containing protein [Planctomycetota bacterium]